MNVLAEVEHEKIYMFFACAGKAAGVTGEIVAKHQPVEGLLECTTPLKQPGPNGKSDADHIVNDFIAMGYFCKHTTLAACDYAAPGPRERLWCPPLYVYYCLGYANVLKLTCLCGTVALFVQGVMGPMAQRPQVCFVGNMQ